jgi:hypothetical protein
MLETALDMRRTGPLARCIRLCIDCADVCAVTGTSTITSALASAAVARTLAVR